MADAPVVDRIPDDAPRHRFPDGAVIFKEGDASTSVLVIETGTITLHKAGPNGPIGLATLEAPEFLGEMGALDGAPRSATAVAVGEVTVAELDRASFLQMLSQDADLAVGILRKVTQRLRAADDMVVQSRTLADISADTAPLRSPPAPAPGQPPVRRGLRARLARLIGRIGHRHRHARAAMPERPITIVFAPIHGDGDGRIRRVLIEGAGDLTPVRIVRGETPVKAPDPVLTDDAAEFAIATGLARKADADLLVWGTYNAFERMVTLRFAPAHADEDRAGVFGPLDRLPLSDSLDDPCLLQMKLALLGAVVPRNGQGAILRHPLVRTAVEVRDNAARPASGLTAEEQADVLVAIAHACANVGLLEARGHWLGVAAENYRAALKRLPEDANDRRASVLRQYGLAQMALADQGGGPKAVETGAKAFRAAIDLMTPERAPAAWALTNLWLASALYRMALVSGGDQELKASMQAHKNALQVFTRSDAPHRWAEIATALAQTLQVFGEQARSAEALDRAAVLCRAALEIRSRTDQPLLWAATQNNLGSALYLRAKHSGDPEPLPAAMAAFREALAVYQDQGADRLARVAEKNLAKAEADFRKYRNRQERLGQGAPGWAAGGGPGETPDQPAQT